MSLAPLFFLPAECMGFVEFSFPFLLFFIVVEWTIVNGDLGGSCHCLPDCYFIWNPWFSTKYKHALLAEDKKNVSVSLYFQKVTCGLSKLRNESLSTSEAAQLFISYLGFENFVVRILKDSNTHTHLFKSRAEFILFRSVKVKSADCWTCFQRGPAVGLETHRKTLALHPQARAAWGGLWKES